ncbi:protein of unknown function [Methylococcus capsulatus]|uniref:Uncharacterized protein n=1 Tax=Methylococcus capsulatus TaxID=414 RepID=A0AA35XYY3_METCP|nr:protein of unknown function [Methylococcus capsulatus]
MAPVYARLYMNRKNKNKYIYIYIF